MNVLKLSAVAATVIGLTGCAVGPDFSRPNLPAAQGYASPSAMSGPLVAPANGESALHFLPGHDIQTDWWTLFQSPQLNALIEKAFEANPSLAVVQASLRVAQENVYAQQGFFFPTVQANYTPSRTKVAGNLGGNSPGTQGNGSVISTYQGTPASAGGTAPFNAPVIYNFHTAQLTVGYTPDVFGGNRRQIESLQAQLRAQRFELEAARITLATNIVAAVIQDALLRRQIATTKDMMAANTVAVQLVQRQLQAGYASRLDLAVQERALTQSRQLLPPLVRQLEQNKNLLCLLVGLPPDAELPAFELNALHLPRELPLTLPSQLVEQRPDVRSAEEQLRAATADVGVARAARVPQFSISATAGGAASRFNQMLWPSGKFFDLALGITQPLFDGGTLKHRERAAEEALRRAGAQYHSAVLNAWQNVADVLQAIQSDADAVAAADATVQVTQVSLELSRRQHTNGYVDRLTLLGAEQTHREALLDQWQAQARRLGDTAALFQALGGGWWHRPDALDATAVSAVVPR